MLGKKKILVFTGAGVSKESGIETFRDSADGLWNNYKIEDVASIQGWRKDKETVLEFYNKRRSQLKEVEPNLAHILISKLEENFDVTVVTQNVDNLHERAGSTNIIHLHGELNKVRSTLDSKLVYDWTEDLNIGDKCEKGSQMRPHIVWFGEMLETKNTSAAIRAAQECDFCIVVGTSMLVSPANEIPFHISESTPLYCIDPDEISFNVPTYMKHMFTHIKEPASIGIQQLYNQLIKEEQKQHLIDMMKGDEELGLYDDNFDSALDSFKKTLNKKYDESREIKVEDIFNDEKKERVKRVIHQHKVLQGLSLVNPAHLEMTSNGHGEFPDGYKLTEKGIQYIIEQLNKDGE